MVESARTSGFAELPHLSTFVRAAEQGSFTAAASQLGIKIEEDLVPTFGCEPVADPHRLGVVRARMAEKNSRHRLP